MPEPSLTPAQQNLMTFLDKLVSTPYSPALMEEGQEALDAAVLEHRSLQDSINEAASQIANHTTAANLDGGIQ